MPKITLPGGFVLDGASVAATSLVAVAIGLAAAGGIWTKTVMQPQVELSRVQQEMAITTAVLNEFMKHAGEKPLVVVTLVPSPSITASLYKDRCTIIAEETDSGPMSMLIQDLSKGKHQHARSEAFSFLPVVEAQQQRAPQCWTPQQHQDRPRVAYGQRSGCLIPMTLAWADGCQQQGVYNECSHVFDLHWTRCVH